MEDSLRGFVFGILHHAPGDIVLQAVVGLPWEGPGMCEFAAFDVVDADVFGEVLLFIGDDSLLHALCAVVIIRHGVPVIFSDNTGAAVKINRIRRVFIDDLADLGLPGSAEGFVRIPVGNIAVGLQGKCGAVVDLVGRVVYIRLVVRGHEPAPEPLVVEGGKGADSLLPEGLQAFSHHVPPGSVVHAVHGVDGAVPHGKIIRMLGDGAGIFRSRPLHQLCPFFRIKFLSLHHGIEILVPEVMKLSVGFHMVYVLFQSAAVHIPGIPLVLVCGHAVRSPVKKHPKFRIPEPFRRFSFQFIPVNLFHIFSPFRARPRCASLCASLCAPI